jgi:hypothetical protein
MSAIWLQSLVPNATPPIHSVFLTYDPGGSEDGVTRYLVTEFQGHFLPIGADHFDSETEAKDRCKEDLGIAPGDWQEVSQEPEFHTPLVEAREEVIQSYLAHAERQGLEDDNSAPFDATPDDLRRPGPRE